ncbi:MAG TPA: alpha/beta fold hydrolase [Terriglobia bacterium]|nr:alpha/beta fold hydrolase [Terriglobia bacterium]
MTRGSSQNKALGKREQSVDPELVIRVLGEFQVLKGQEPQTFPHSRKTRALLAYLVLTGRRHRRERLCDLFWDAPDDPRASLRWSLSRLRSLVDEPGAERIVADREYVFFEPKGTRVDLFEIRRELTGDATGLPTERLIALAEQFRGELLEDLTIPDQRDFEAWIVTERETARRTRASLLRVLVERLNATPNATPNAAPNATPDATADAAAVRYAGDLVAADPYSVSAHAAFIRSLSNAGRRKEAESQCDISMKQLRETGARDLRALTDALHMTGPVPVTPPERRPEETRLEQEIRFCSTSDRTRIAYASVGKGPALIKTANWLNHLEYDWDSPIWRHLFRELARDRRLIRYDARGNGLSDWDVDDISFDAFVRDLESVVEAAGVDRFPLLGISQGCAISIEYVIRNPGRVTRLVLHGGYAAGWRVWADPADLARREAMQTLILHGWDLDNPAFRQVFTSSFIPDSTPEQVLWMNELMRVSTSPQNAIRIQEAVSTIDVRHRLPLVDVPTLVLHSRNDARVPYRRGLELAYGIPNARLVTLESDNHLLLEHEPEFPRFLEAIRKFLEE